MTKSADPFLTWAEIDLAAFRHNFRLLKSLAAKHNSAKSRSDVAILPVIKADAYGHGMLEAAEELERIGVNIFAVSDVVEGMELRRNGFKNEILLLESALPDFAGDIVTCALIPSVCSLDLARHLNAHAKARSQKLKIHIKVDTGMGRLGVWHEDALDFIRMVAGFSHLVIDGIFTHFPLADSDRQFTERQIRDFEMLIASLGEIGQNLRFIHAANSMGLSGYQTKIFNLARPGLMLYGLYPTEKIKKTIKLKPVMSVKTHILHLKDLPKGRGVSYGHTFIAKKNIRTATLAVGYSDGYFRSLSNKSHVLIHGQRCPVIGNVTMDQIIVDVSRLKTVKVGELAIIIGQDRKQHITAEELARHAGTINYEIVCNLGNRLVRSYKD